MQNVVKDYAEDGAPDPDDTEAYICGLRPMVKAAKETIEDDLGMASDRVNFELYA